MADVLLRNHSELIDEDLKKLVQIFSTLPKEERAFILAGAETLKIRLDLERSKKDAV